MRGRAAGRRIRFAAILAFSATLLAGAGCQKRDHSNPFDPSNPESHGVPSLLAAQAGDRRVDLMWDFGGVEGIRRVDILRRAAGNETEAPVNRIGIDPSVRAFTDDSVANDSTYEYRLDLELASGAHLSTARDAATPGDAVPWVSDSDGGGLSRLTADARHLLSSFGQGLWFLDVAADSVRRTVWAVEYLGGTVYEFDSRGERIFEGPLEGARAVAVDSAGVWAGSFDTGRILRLTFDGATVAADTLAGHVEALLALPTGEVWVALLEGRIEIGTQEGDHLRFATIGGFERPVAMTVSGPEVFVLDRGSASLVRLDTNGNVQARSAAGLLIDPTDLAPDGAGGIWVCDPGRGGLVRFDRGFVEIAYAPVGAAFGVTWDRGRLWVAGGMGVRLLDRNGTVISGLEIGPRPVRVAVVHVSSLEGSR